MYLRIRRAITDYGTMVIVRNGVCTTPTVRVYMCDVEKSVAFFFFRNRRPFGEEIDTHLAIHIERLVSRDLEFAQFRRGHWPVLPRRIIFV
jgi:hypothetical protein